MMKKLLILLMVSSLGLTLAPAHAARKKAKPKQSRLEKKVSALERNQQILISLHEKQARSIEEIQQRLHSSTATEKGKFDAIPYSYP